ncbi:MAG: thiamine pyrophosphate-binding protein [Deltaproteobacteria bacterium]|nr:MAG: thiamine pyrophosphate-binding protein [Deltaproteobacteria bacterium]
MKGGDILIECLKAQGVRCIFGMPGTQNMQIYDSLLRCGAGVIDHYLVRHEYAATQMADGYARSTGEVGVALTVPGPGASNASTGILEAFTDCVPVLLITGQSDSKFYTKDPSKMFHGLDQMGFFRSITKYCAIAQKVEDIPTVVENAFRSMRTGRPGPAVLEFPVDVLTGESDLIIPPRVHRPARVLPDAADLRSAAETLKRAEMPILFVGSAVIHSDAREELHQLAEKLNAPVVVTRCAKGALREDHPLALQNSNGFLARQAIELADCTLAIGPRFTSLDTRNWSLELPRPLVQIDEDAAEIGREYPCDIGVVGDLKLTLQVFIEEVDEAEGTWKPLLDRLRERFATQPRVPLLPEIREVLPADGILSVDVHAIGYASFAEFPVDKPRTFLYPCIGVALGYAFPAALGAKIAHPDKPVVCFSGDGGFMMGASEMATAMMYGINVVAVIVNDSALSSIKGSQWKYCEGRTVDTDLVNPDFVQFAKSFGAYAVRVEELSDFKSALQDALAADRPALIEVPMQDRQKELIGLIGWLQSEPLRKARNTK